MAEQRKKLLQRLTDLDALREGFLIRFALVRHNQTADHLRFELEEEIRNINEVLEATQRRANRCHPGSGEEANCMVRIRELEDLRFQLLSRLNGNRVEAYNTLSPHYPHV